MKQYTFIHSHENLAASQLNFKTCFFRFYCSFTTGPYWLSLTHLQLLPGQFLTNFTLLQNLTWQFFAQFS